MLHVFVEQFQTFSKNSALNRLTDRNVLFALGAALNYQLELIKLFKYSQEMKCKGVKSGDLGGHVTGPPRLIHLPLYL